MISIQIETIPCVLKSGYCDYFIFAEGKTVGLINHPLEISFNFDEKKTVHSGLFFKVSSTQFLDPSAQHVFRVKNHLQD